MDLNTFKKQLDNCINQFTEMQKVAEHNDLSDLPKEDRQSVVTRVITAVQRITGVNSTYSKEVQRILTTTPQLHIHTTSIIGVAKALRQDIEEGVVLQGLAEIAQAEIFSDYLEMAIHLLESGYKDPASVIAGSTLESHLRKIAEKNSIAITDANGKNVRADKLNADIVKSGVYNVLDQKNVVAWLDLRNKAAHGNYSEYNSDQVKLLITGIRDFITRHQA